MIQPHVVRDKIEHQLQTAFRKPLAQARQRRIASKIRMDLVAGDGKSGAGDVFLAQIRQCFLKSCRHSPFLARYLLAGFARAPHAQEPDPVKAHLLPDGPARHPEYRRAWRAAPMSLDSSVSQTRVLT